MSLSRVVGMLFLAVSLMLVVAPASLSAQCTEGCAVINDDDGEVVGHACVDFGDPTGRSGCMASGRGCSTRDCEPQMVYLLDAVGIPAAAALVCGEVATLPLTSTPMQPTASQLSDDVISPRWGWGMK